MKLSGNRIRTHSGKILHFKSAAARETYERIAKAVDHGWKPTMKKKSRKKKGY
jgi:hypothetical protein